LRRLTSSEEVAMCLLRMSVQGPLHGLCILDDYVTDRHETHCSQLRLTQERLHESSSMDFVQAKFRLRLLDLQSVKEMHIIYLERPSEDVVLFTLQR